MPADSRDMVLVPREPTEAMIWAGALAAMEAATEFMEDDFWKDRHLQAIERMKRGDYGSEDDRAKGLKVGSALYRAMISASPARGEGEPCFECGSTDFADRVCLGCNGIEDRAPSPGEGDAPVAWPSKTERDRAAQAVCGANAIMGREPLSEGASYTLADVVLREVAPPKAVVIENTPENGGEAHCVDNAVDARNILAGGYDARARRVARAYLELAAAQAERLVSGDTSQSACSGSVS